MSTPGDQSARAHDVAMRVLASPKYRELEPSFVARIASEATRSSSSTEAAVKLAKRRLHQAFGAFLHGRPAVAVRDAVKAVRDGSTPLDTAFVTAMRAHASTAERVPHLDRFGELIGEWSPGTHSVVDLACGLSPLAIPWLPLEPGASYSCCDIDTALASALLELNQVLDVDVQASCCDLVRDPPSLHADLALLLKTMPTLEQQAPGSTRRVIERLQCGHVVLSLPTRSLGGRVGYTSDGLQRVVDLVQGTRYSVAGDAAIGREHFFHLVPRTSASR